ncbi:MAG TPA: transposase [Gemmatimonadaceae bacterium]|nr:transposase [Gemmatimonadaceae bacterium]
METLEPIVRLDKDLKAAATTLSVVEARYLVDQYYVLQHDRIRAAHQVRATAEAQEPHQLLQWVQTNTGVLEQNIKRALDAYTDSNIVGRWSKSIVGVGPVIAAGLLAHIDVAQAPTVGHIWRFAGLDPTVTWGKGEKRPWNARLKTLCWKIGESFVKVSGREGDFYGQLYLQRKAIEVERNEAKAFAAQAAASLAGKRYGADTQARKAYEQGMLPPARIHLRAERWAVKIFLAHWHAVAYRAKFGTDAPKPYVLAILGHADEIQVPNWPWA